METIESGTEVTWESQKDKLNNNFGRVNTNALPTSGMSNGDTVIFDGSQWIYDSAESATDNGGTIIDGWVRQYDGAISVKWFELLSVGDDWTLAFDAATALGGDIYVPEGYYETSTGVWLESNTIFRGAGIDKTIIKLTDGAATTIHVVTNAQNTDITKPPSEGDITNLGNTNIQVSDMTLDGNGARTSDGGSGSAIKFASVSNSSIERVKAINGIVHCVDIGSGHYGSDYGWGIRSSNIVIRDVVAYNPKGDDAITTHFCDNILIEDSHAYMDQPFIYAPRKQIAAQHGIEIDDGSNEVTVRNCTATGFFSNFQVKGHADNAPATNTHLTNCVSFGSNVAFDITHGGSDPGDPHEGEAKGVSITGCRVVDPQVVDKYNHWSDTTPQSNERVTSLTIEHYEDVIVEDFIVEGDSTLIDTEAAVIFIQDGSGDISLNNVTLKNVNNNLNGAIHITDDAGDNIRITNVTAVDSFGVIVWITSGREMVIDDVYAYFTGDFSWPSTAHTLPIYTVVAVAVLSGLQQDGIIIKNVRADSNYTYSTSSQIQQDGTDTDHRHLPNDNESERNSQTKWVMANSADGTAGEVQLPISVGWVSGNQNMGFESVGYGFKEMYEEDGGNPYLGAYIALTRADAVDANHGGTLVFATLNDPDVDPIPTPWWRINKVGHFTPITDNVNYFGDWNHAPSRTYSHHYYINNTPGASGSFTTNDGKTVTVVGGLITNIQ